MHQPLYPGWCQLEGFRNLPIPPSFELAPMCKNNLRNVAILVVIVVSVSGNTWGAAGVSTWSCQMSRYTVEHCRAIMAFKCWQEILIHFPCNWKGIFVAQHGGNVSCSSCFCYMKGRNVTYNPLRYVFNFRTHPRNVQAFMQPWTWGREAGNGSKFWEPPPPLDWTSGYWCLFEIGFNMGNLDMRFSPHM